MADLEVMIKAAGDADRPLLAHILELSQKYYLAYDCEYVTPHDSNGEDYINETRWRQREIRVTKKMIKAGKERLIANGYGGEDRSLDFDGGGGEQIYRGMGAAGRKR